MHQIQRKQVISCYISQKGALTLTYWHVQLISSDKDGYAVSLTGRKKHRPPQLYKERGRHQHDFASCCQKARKIWFCHKQGYRCPAATWPHAGLISALSGGWKNIKYVMMHFCVPGRLKWRSKRRTPVLSHHHGMALQTNLLECFVCLLWKTSVKFPLFCLTSEYLTCQMLRCWPQSWDLYVNNSNLQGR